MLRLATVSIKRPFGVVMIPQVIPYDLEWSMETVEHYAAGGVFEYKKIRTDPSVSVAKALDGRPLPETTALLVNAEDPILYIPVLDRLVEEKLLKPRQRFDLSSYFGLS